MCDARSVGVCRVYRFRFRVRAPYTGNRGSLHNPTSPRETCHETPSSALFVVCGFVGFTPPAGAKPGEDEAEAASTDRRGQGASLLEQAVIRFSEGVRPWTWSRGEGA